VSGRIARSIFNAILVTLSLGVSTAWGVQGFGFAGSVYVGHAGPFRAQASGFQVELRDFVYVIVTVSNNGLPVGNVRIGGSTNVFPQNLTFLDCSENCVLPSVPLSFDGRKGFGLAIALTVGNANERVTVTTDTGTVEIPVSVGQAFEDGDQTDPRSSIRPFADGRNSYPSRAGQNVLLSTRVLDSNASPVSRAQIRWSALGGKSNQILFSSRSTSVDGTASATFKTSDDLNPNVVKAVVIDPSGRRGVAYFIVARMDTSTSRQGAPTCVLENASVRSFPGQTVSLSAQCDRPDLNFTWTDVGGRALSATSTATYIVPANATGGSELPVLVTASGGTGTWQGRVTIRVDSSALACEIQTRERTTGSLAGGSVFGFGQPLELQADCTGGAANKTYTWLVNGSPAANSETLNICLDDTKSIVLRVASAGVSIERSKQIEIVTNYAQKYARIQFFENASIPNTSTPHYFMTANRAEANAVRGGGAGPGWQQIATEWGWNGDSWIKGAGPVCRFYSPVVNSHFYTANVGECCSLRTGNTGWKFEELAFVAVTPTAEQCPEGLVPVFRAYNKGFDTRFRDTNHFYTTSASAYQSKISSGWAPEGVAFCVRSGSAIALDAQVLSTAIVNGSDGGGDSDGAGGASSGSGDGLVRPPGDR
jgi:hypothetical protein